MLNKLKRIASFNASCIKQSFLAAKEGVCFDTNEENIDIIEGYQVVLSNNLLQAHGALIGAAVNGLFGGFVLVDQHFLDMSDVAQKFIVLHEIGHLEDTTVYDYKSAREQNKNRKYCTKQGTIAPEELVADQYAFDSMGELAIEALIEVRMFVKGYSFGSASVNEIDLRIGNLKRQLK